MMSFILKNIPFKLSHICFCRLLHMIISYVKFRTIPAQVPRIITTYGEAPVSPEDYRTQMEELLLFRFPFLKLYVNIVP